MKGQAPLADKKPADNVEYDRLPRDLQEVRLAADFRKWVEEVGGCIHDHRVVIPLGRVRYVWRYIVQRACTQESLVWTDVSALWQYEHGILYLVMGTVSKRALPSWARIHFKEKWGWFSAVDDITHAWSRHLAWVPFNTKRFSLVTFTLPHLSDTDSLRNSLSSLLQFLHNDATASTRIRQAREQVNYNLRRWLSQGWIYGTGSHYIGVRPKKETLGEDEFFDIRWGNQVMRRHRHERLEATAQTVLDLSSGRLP